MDRTPLTRINKHTFSVLSPVELKALRHACRVSGLPFVAMACQPVPARQLIAEVSRREAKGEAL